MAFSTFKRNYMTPLHFKGLALSLGVIPCEYVLLYFIEQIKMMNLILPILESVGYSHPQ